MATFTETATKFSGKIPKVSFKDAGTSEDGEEGGSVAGVCSSISISISLPQSDCHVTSVCVEETVSPSPPKEGGNKNRQSHLIPSDPNRCPSIIRMLLSLSECWALCCSERTKSWKLVSHSELLFLAPDASSSSFSPLLSPLS